MGKDRTLEIIKTEIERLKELHKTPTFKGDEYEEGGVNGYQLALDKLLSFLDTLESEKPQVDLDEETIRIEFHTIADKCFNEGIEGWQREKLIARHFAKWGAEHLADARKTSSGSSEIPNDLEKVAKLYALDDQYKPWGNMVKDAFIAGAKWKKGQMMKEAVEGRVYDFRRIKEIGYSSAKIEFDKIPELDDGDKVRIIIVKED